MNKKLKIFLIVIAVIVAIVSAVAIWQWENISAFIDGVSLDETEIAQKSEQSEKEVVNYLENNNIGTVRPMTDEETAALNNNEITKSDATKIMTGQLTLEEAKANKAETDKNQSENKPEQPQNKPSDNKPSDNNTTANNSQEGKQEQNNQTTKPEEQPSTDENVDYDTLISEKVAELYVIKANYYAEFGSYWAAARAEFLARPVEEHTQANLAATVKSYMSQGLAMEDRYDAQVDEVVAELTELLKAAGRDTELATAVKTAYINEKKAEKARIINRYFG